MLQRNWQNLPRSSLSSDSVNAERATRRVDLNAVEYQNESVEPDTTRLPCFRIRWLNGRTRKRHPSNIEWRERRVGSLTRAVENAELMSKQTRQTVTVNRIMALAVVCIVLWIVVTLDERRNRCCINCHSTRKNATIDVRRVECALLFGIVKRDVCSRSRSSYRSLIVLHDQSCSFSSSLVRRRSIRSDGNIIELTRLHSSSLRLLRAKSLFRIDRCCDEHPVPLINGILMIVQLDRCSVAQTRSL